MICSSDFFRFVRAVRRASGAGARHGFFATLLKAACPGAEAALAGAAGGEGGAEDVDVPRGILHELQADPLLVGWAYQVWNEPERKGSIWGVSRREERQAERLNITAATQIFTEGYMASFLCERAWSLGKLRAEVCDPACGTGHLLVQALRAMHAHCPEDRIEGLLERLYGFDIDPFAVAITRGVLVAEAARLSTVQPQDALEVLSGQIVALEGQSGSLDRTPEHPLLGRTFGCVLANPPYLGRRKLSQEMRDLLDREFPDCAFDLCAAFVQRAIELLAPEGFLGLVTHDKWLRLKGYRKLRNGGATFGGVYRELEVDAVCELGKRAFDRKLGLHDGLGVALLTGTKSRPRPEHQLRLVSLVGLPDSDAKAEQLAKLSRAWAHSSSESRCVPQSRLAVEPHDRLFMEGSMVPAALHGASRYVGGAAHVVVGLQTNDDRRFVRNHWEVEPDSSRWRVHARGGGYGRWYGLNRAVLDWGGGREIFGLSARSGIAAASWFDRPGWVYSWFANGSIGLRVKEEGWSFGRAAASGFFCEDLRIVAFLNSRFASRCARGLGGKVQLPEGVVRRLPLPESLEGVSKELVSAAVRVKRELVQHDITEITYEPGRTAGALELVAIEAVLRMVEATLELQVAQVLGAHDELRSGLENGPVGLLPLCADVSVDEFWSLVPPGLASMREVVEVAVDAAGRKASSLSSGEDSEIEKAVVEGVATRSDPRGLPADGRLERLCGALMINPVEAAVRIARLHAESLQARHALELPLAQQSLFAALLDGIGHPWWSRAEERRSTRRGDISLNEAQSIAAASKAGQRFEQASGASASAWIRDSMDAWQRRVFGARGPLVLRRGGVHRELLNC